MTGSNERYIHQTLAMALGVILMMPDTDTKSELIERLKRSMEKLDAVELPPNPMAQTPVSKSPFYDVV